LGKILGIDFGDKRVGLALSDEKKIIAFPFKTVDLRQFSREIDGIILNEQVEEIVVGLPRNMDGTLGGQAEKVKAFVKDSLGKYLTMVHYQDETGTSIAASQILREQKIDPRKEKDLIDKASARIILNDYLTERGKSEF